MNIDCPHCGRRTILSAETAAVEPTTPPVPTPANDGPGGRPASPAPKTARPRVGSSVGLIATVAVVALLVGLTTVGFVFYAKQTKDRRPTLPVAPPPEPQVKSLPPEPGSTPPDGPASAAAVASTPKSIDDLKVGNITLEKAKGTSLIYAVGTLKNDSDHQRFGIKIELDLLDARSERVGVAKDYRSTLEPRQQWRFRALVLDNRAVSAQVASIEEDQ